MNFFAPCIPPTVTAQQKGSRVARGRVIHYTKPEVLEAREYLSVVLAEHIPDEPFQGALAVTFHLVFPFRRQDEKRNEDLIWHWCRPDSSNLIKLVEDVMTDLGFWKDDGQISNLQVVKMRGRRQTGIGVRIEQLTEPPEYEF